MKRTKQLQARQAHAVVLLTKHVKSFKKPFTYTKEERKAILERNGLNYQPLVAGVAIRNMTVSQQARIYRQICREERPASYETRFASLPLWGNVFSIKKIFCENTLGPLKV